MYRIIILFFIMLVGIANAELNTVDTKTTISLDTNNTIVSKFNIVQAIGYFRYIGKSDLDYKQFKNDNQGIKSLLGTNLFTVYHPQAKYINKFGTDIVVDPDNFTRLWGISPKIEVKAVSTGLFKLADIVKIPVLEQGLTYLANNGVYTAGFGIVHDFHYNVIKDWDKGNYGIVYFSYGQFPKFSNEKDK